jgi:hypothetical protein
MKVEAFKIGVQRVLKTIKFAEFEKQEWGTQKFWLSA